MKEHIAKVFKEALYEIDKCDSQHAVNAYVLVNKAIILIAEDQAKYAAVCAELESVNDELSATGLALAIAKNELEELQNSLPKVKADAVRDYGKYITETLSNDDLVDVKLIMTPEQYADKLEKGE